MRMRISTISVFFLGVVLLTSCHTHKLTVEVYTPPKVELPPDVRGILVSSRFVPATGEYEAVQWGYFDDVDSTLWELSRYYAEAFSNALDSSTRFVSKTDFNIRMLRHNALEMPEPLPWKGLLGIVDKYKAPGLAILQGFEVEEKDVEINEVENGTEISYQAVKKITISSSWRITQPERRRLLDENTYRFTKEFTAIGRDPDEAKGALPNILVMHKEACNFAAQGYSRMLIPGVEEVEREYYKDGDIKLEEAHQAVLEGDWKKAESRWERLAYEAEDIELKAKCNFNMALLCERDGRLNQALGFARKANKFLPHRRHLKLINDLNTKMFLEEDMRARKEIIRNW